MPKSHPEYDALYAAVCADPEDDTARLVLADWLDEHDDPHRAAYIRAQVGLEQVRESDPHAAALFHFHSTPSHHNWNSYADPALVSPAVARMCALSKQCVAHGKQAAARWKAVLEKRKSGTIGFGRGFPASVYISNAKQYAEKQPPENLPRYSLAVNASAPEHLDALFGCANFAGATGFVLSGVTTPDPVRKLGAQPAVRNFRSLSLGFEAADPAILAAVASQPNWCALTYLSLDSSLNRGSPRLDLPEEFAGATHLRTLTSLSLGLRALSGVGLTHLAKLGLPHLQRLDAHYNAVASAGALALTTGKFPELRELDLGTNRIGNDGATMFANCRGKLAHLAALSLAGNDITDPEVMSALLAGPAFPVLGGLSLRDNRAHELDPKILASPGRGPTLRLLSLRHCSLSAKAGAALASAPALAGLVGLDLAGNEIGDTGASAIARGGSWSNMTCLDLGENGITGEGVKALVPWIAERKLVFLDLGGNPIGMEGARALVACKALKKCRKIVVSYREELLPADGMKLLLGAFGRRLDRA